MRHIASYFCGQEAHFHFTKGPAEGCFGEDGAENAMLAN